MGLQRVGHNWAAFLLSKEILTQWGWQTGGSTQKGFREWTRWKLAGVGGLLKVSSEEKATVFCVLLGMSFNPHLTDPTICYVQLPICSNYLSWKGACKYISLESGIWSNSVIPPIKSTIVIASIISVFLNLWNSLHPLENMNKLWFFPTGEEGRKKHKKKFRDFFLKYWTIT